jgi:hypothetical protein
VRARHTRMAGMDGMFKVKRRIGTQATGTEYRLRLMHRYFTYLCATSISHQRCFGNEDQLVSTQRRCGR